MFSARFIADVFIDHIRYSRRANEKAGNLISVVFNKTTYLGHGDTICPNGTQPLVFPIRNCQVVPSPHFNVTAPNRRYFLTRSRCKSNEPLSPTGFANNPEMHSTPRQRLVMKDWPGALGFYPNYYSYIVHCVQFTLVWKVHIAVSTTRELNGTGGKAIRSGSGAYINQFS